MEQDSKSPKNIYFFSDAHLSIIDSPSEREAKVVELLQKVRADGSHLYIVGDLFDFWFEYRYAVPAAYLKILSELLRLTESGVRVFYSPGNHDFWMRDYITRQAGVTILPEFYETTHFGKKLLITHGDGLRKDDVGYRILKAIFRNRVCVWLYSQLPVGIAYRLAMRSSHASRQYTNSRKWRDSSDYVEFARRQIAEKGYDAVVMGHVHQPEMVDLGAGKYINCGDFFDSFSYVVLGEPGGFEMRRMG